MVDSKQGMMTPEQYFFRYAWPCAEILLIRGKISDLRYNELKLYAETGKTPPRELLEETYKRAVANMKEISEDCWSIDTVRKYFREDHNMFVDSGRGEISKCTPAQQELCKVYEATATEVKKAGDYNIVIVAYPNGERRCIDLYNLGINTGDNVTIHYNIIIEKLKNN